MSDKSERKKKTPWQKIVRAAQNGRGLRLTADEIGQLWMDDAICTKAQNDDEEQAALRLIETGGQRT